MNFLRNIIITILIIPLIVDTGKAQKVKNLKDGIEYGIIHRANFSATFYFGGEFNLMYQLGIQRNNHSFLLGIGPSFFSKYNTKGCNFIGVSNGFEYNYGIKWRFTTGVSMFNGWILDKSVVSPIGGCLSNYRSTIAIPIGCMYSTESGFFIDLSYFPLINIPIQSWNLLNFKIAIGFALTNRIEK